MNECGRGTVGGKRDREMMAYATVIVISPDNRPTYPIYTCFNVTYLKPYHLKT